MERGRKYIYIFSTASFLFSSFFFLSIVSSGSEQQTITHTRLIRRALCGVLRRSQARMVQFFISFSIFLWCAYLFLRGDIKVKTIYKSCRKKKKWWGRREVRDDERRGGKPYCTSDLRPSKNGTHVNIWMEKDTIHLEYVNSTRHRMEKRNKINGCNS